MSQIHELELLAETYAVARLDSDADVPGWIGGKLQSVTRTADELSIVCAGASVPKHVDAQRGFRCLRIVGRLDFAATGVLESLLRPLADAGVSVFVLSTFNTDYLLVPGDRLDKAATALVDNGHTII